MDTLRRTGQPKEMVTLRRQALPLKCERAAWPSPWPLGLQQGLPCAFPVSLSPVGLGLEHPIGHFHTSPLVTQKSGSVIRVCYVYGFAVLYLMRLCSTNYVFRWRKFQD